MKLLYDQNLSFALVAKLASLFSGSDHVRNHGLATASDKAVWDFARSDGFTIVSKDSDFRQRSFLYGHPPRVIWLDVGNCPTAHVESLLRANYTAIVDFHRNPAASFLVVR